MRVVETAVCRRALAGRRKEIAALLIAAFFGLASADGARGQNLVDEGAPSAHSPQGALWRAAAFPGWGQLYNRQYYKIPVVWAGLGGLTATALYVNHRYLLYRHAYHYVSGANTSPEYQADYLRLLNDLNISEERGEQLEGAFRETRDNLRRNRDLLYIGVGLFYGLSILDAYVNAHLLDFDVGEDLSLSIRAVPRGLTASVRLRR